MEAVEQVMKLASAIEGIIREAGKTLKAASVTTGDIHKKDGAANFVTDYDLQIQRFLIERFAKLLPAASFYGEEDTEGNDHNLDGYCFFIDPIDGTTNFMFGYNHSCISVGLAYQKQMLAGFVLNPYVDELVSAIQGQGAFKNGIPMKICNKALGEGIAAFGCARYNDDATDQFFALVKELYLRSLSIRNGGSAALDLCRVATGSNVLYVEGKLQPYDYAAASIIIEEAGGIITQMDGAPITLDRPCSILAGSKMAWEEVGELIPATSCGIPRG